MSEHPWTDLDAALVLVFIDWQIKCDDRPKFGEGSDLSDLMDQALTRVKGLCSGELDPLQVQAEIMS